jgi:BMFP domain-containing protein YqiC
MEVYGRDPQRFEDRDLDPEAFPDPLRIPDEDRQAVRDALRGVFGDAVDPDDAEAQLADDVSTLLDRALSIDPAHRFTDARDVSAAFEGLTRSFLALSAHVESATRNMDPDQLVAALENERVRNEVLRQRLGHLEAQLAAPPPAASSAAVQVPLWMTSLLVGSVALQGLTLVAVVLLWVVWATSGGPGVVAAGL